jgi:hypothetical protein
LLENKFRFIDRNIFVFPSFIESPTYFDSLFEKSVKHDLQLL